jgi:AcrR family transcriptional regulator
LPIFKKNDYSSPGMVSPFRVPEEPEEVAVHDELGEALLDAAAIVFAQQGFDGTRIGDIVRQAGLSTGAAYGRFPSRETLLRQAVISRSVPHVQAPPPSPGGVAELVARSAAHVEAELDGTDALVLEAFVAARRHPPIADALQEAQRRWREEIQVLVDAALADGSLRADLDVEAVLYLMRVLRLGRLLMRASGLPAPDPERWQSLVRVVVDSLGGHLAPTHDGGNA